MTDENRDFLAKLNAYLDVADLVYEISGPMKVPCEHADGTFRHVPLVGEEEFIVRSIRFGAKGQLIFVGEPVDARPYVKAEFDEKKVFEAFPALEEDLITGFFAMPECKSFAEARARFHIKEKKIAATEKKLAEEDAAIIGSAINDTWGMF